MLTSCSGYSPSRPASPDALPSNLELNLSFSLVFGELALLPRTTL